MPSLIVDEYCKKSILELSRYHHWFSYKYGYISGQNAAHFPHCAQQIQQATFAQKSDVKSLFPRREEIIFQLIYTYARALHQYPTGIFAPKAWHPPLP